MAKRRKDDVVDECIWKPAPGHRIDSPLVSLEVGPDNISSTPVTINVHRDVLKHFSGYFRGGFTGNFAEAEEGLIKLTDDSPARFRHLTTWIYTGEVPEQSNPTSTSSNVNIKFTSFDTILCEMWVIAGSLNMPTLQNCSLNALYQTWCHRRPDMQPHLHQMWGAMSTDCQLASLIGVALYCFSRHDPAWLVIQDPPKIELHRMIKKMARSLQALKLSEWRACRFHKHEERQPAKKHKVTTSGSSD